MGKHSAIQATDLAIESGSRSCFDLTATGQLRPAVVTTRALREAGAATARVVLIVAPPGFGKTTLLRALCRQRQLQGRPVTWRDGQKPASPLPSAAVRPARGGERTCFIDDAHTIEAAKLQSILRAAAESASGQYIVASRILPDLDWLSLQSVGRALVFDLRDLSLSRDEIAEFVELYGGRPGAREALRLIEDVTEGWPIAVQLCALKARREADWSGRFARSFEFEGDVARYLREAVLADLDPELRDFLVATSHLDHICEDLCQAVWPNGASLFRRALASGLFVLPSERGGAWRRLHPLFAGCLRKLAGETDTAALMSRSSAWSADHGAPGDAIEYALRAHDFARAHGLLVEAAPELVHRLGALPQLLGWMQVLERHGIEPEPDLRHWKVWALIFLLRLDDARRELAGLGLVALGPANNPALTAGCEHLRCSLAARGDNLDEVMDLASAWLDRWRDTEPFLAAAVAVMLSLAQFHRNDEIGVRRSLDLACRAADQCGSAYAQVWLATVEAYVALGYGRAVEAREIAEGAIHAASRDIGAESPIVSTLCLVAARARLETGDIAEARQYLDRGLAHIHDHGLIDTMIMGLETRFFLIEIVDGPEAAIADMRRSAVQGRRCAVAIRKHLILLLLRTGQPAEARAEFEAAFAAEGGSHLNGRDLMGEFQHERQEIAFLEAAISMAERRFARGAEHCKALLPHSEAHRLTRRTTQLLVLRAYAALGRGERSAAIRDFRRALRLAAEGELVHTLCELDWCVLDLLGLMGDAAEWTVRERGLLDRARARLGVAPADAAAGKPVSEPLTDRERELLRLLDSGLTNQGVAEQLCLSLATVKWHMQNIYRKLGVFNRTGALARSRHLAML